MKKLIIAIDGPVGSGKSTVAKIVAEKLGYIYIDTGAMYRAVTLKALQATDDKLNIENIKDYKKDIIDATKNSDIKLTNDGKIYLDGKDISDKIRTPQISALSSPISAIEEVREILTKKQREIGKNGGVVMEGRDIGTVVFSDADLKIFLTASITERAKRRYLELKEKGYNVNLQDVRKDLEKRDYQDSTRLLAPLKKADDGIELNTDNIKIEDVVEKIIALIERKLRNEEV